jgi:hypothetical protein
MAISSLLVVLNALRLAGRAQRLDRCLMDILYLLIPLSVVLVFFILAGVVVGHLPGPVRRHRIEGSGILASGF